MIKRIKKLYNNLDIHTAEVVRKSAASVVVKILSMLIAFAVSIFLGRTLGADGLGIINLSNRIVYLIIVIGLFGMRQVIIKEIAIAKNNNDLEHIGNVMFTAYWFNVGITLLISILLILLTPWIANEIFHEPRLIYPLVVALIVVVPQILSRVFSSAFVGYRKIWQSNLVENALSIAITGIVLVGLRVFSIEININNVAISYAIGRIAVTIVVSLYWNSLYKFKQKRKLIINKLIKTAFPLFIVSFSAVIMKTADAIILGMFTNAKDVGLYTVAARIALLSIFLLQVTNATVAPKIASMFDAGNKKELETMIQKITKGLVIIGVFQLVVFISFGNFILRLWGAEFIDAYWILVILSIGQFVNIGTGAAGSMLIMTNNEKTQMLISVASVIIAIIFYVVLIQRFGSIGASIATSFILIFENILRVIYLKVKTGINIYSFLKTK